MYVVFLKMLNSHYNNIGYNYDKANIQNVINWCDWVLDRKSCHCDELLFSDLRPCRWESTQLRTQPLRHKSKISNVSSHCKLLKLVEQTLKTNLCRKFEFSKKKLFKLALCYFWYDSLVYIFFGWGGKWSAWHSERENWGWIKKVELRLWSMHVLHFEGRYE